MEVQHCCCFGCWGVNPGLRKRHRADSPSTDMLRRSCFTFLHPSLDLCGSSVTSGRERGRVGEGGFMVGMEDSWGVSHLKHMVWLAHMYCGLVAHLQRQGTRFDPPFVFLSFFFIVMMSRRSSWVLTYLADEVLVASLRLLSTSVSRAPFLAITSFYSSWLTLHTLPSVTPTSSPLLTSSQVSDPAFLPLAIWFAA